MHEDGIFHKLGYDNAKVMRGFILESLILELNTGDEGSIL